MNIVEVSIISCWVIWLLYWIISSAFQKRVAEKSSHANNIFQWLVMIIAIIFLVRYDLFSSFSIVIVRQSLAVDIISVSLCVIGLIIEIWARTVLAGNWSARVVLKKDHELIQEGPYSVIRHPIYTGFLVIFFGTALAAGRIGGLIGLVILFIGLWIKLKQEERLMIKHFGKKYIDYKKRTKALIPYIL
jgi:protein-S-isoprenylcysteine O-methyltransferase Ste14